MIYLIIYLVVILTGCLWLFYKWYRQEQQEQDERILQLEKRIEDYKKKEKEQVEVLKIIVQDIDTNFERIQKRIEKLEKKKKSDK